ncbi:pPIWI_RE module domain-containing protein [Streptosporangium amethystogenes]|uniref:pPIWI_RE module domain-containing protein n=1 Tax=Streptosporangium amethystogenes TaxID=2002 RepID=UPI0037986EDB
MAVKYRSISLTAYQPSENTLVKPFQVLRIPEGLRAAFAQAHRSGLGDIPADRVKTFPIRSLNALLPLAAPDVISVGQRVSMEDDVPWLYAHHPVDDRIVRGLLKVWLLGMRGEESLRERAYDLLTGAKLPWRTKFVDLAGRVMSDGETAQPEPPLYHLLPDYVARLIQRHGEFRGANGRSWSFLETPTTDRRAQLVSWPPRGDPSETPGALFSYLITVTVQTVPFTSQFRLHVRTGVRRWVTEVNAQGTVYTGGRSASVHVITDTQWPGASGDSTRIAIHRLRYDFKKAEHTWRAVDRPDLLPRASLVRSAVDAADLGRNPRKYLEGLEGIRAGIPHHTTMGSHGVGAGLMSADRVPLMAWIDEALSPEFTRAPACRRAPWPAKPLNAPKKLLAPRKGTEDDRLRILEHKKAEQAARDAVERRHLLREALEGSPLVARVHWQETETRDALVTSLCGVLGLPAPDSVGETLTWRTPELDVILQVRPTGDIGAALEVNAAKPTSAEQLREAIAKRRSEVADAMNDGEAGLRPLVALVEIEKDFKVKRSDSKFAVRLGCADAGVITQFIQTAVNKGLKKNCPHRAKMAWLDVFRQFGACRIPQHTFVDKFPEDLQYIAIWMAKRRKDGPTRQAVRQLLAIRVRPADGVRGVSGWLEDERRWAPYPEYLLWLAKGINSHTAADEIVADEEAAEDNAQSSISHWDKERKNLQRRTATFLRPLLAQLRDRPTLLMVHAQNLRDGWPWLNNGMVIQDHIWVDDGDPVPISLWGNRLRLLRVRDSSRDETPQWYATDGDHGIPAGLWPLTEARGERVFYSSTDRPSTAKKASIKARKEGVRFDRTGKEVRDTDKNAFNPNLLEIAVLACQSGDEPGEWAACVHQLRHAPDINAPLALPFPLHLAKQAVEYVLPNTKDDA